MTWLRTFDLAPFHSRPGIWVLTCRAASMTLVHMARAVKSARFNVRIDRKTDSRLRSLAFKAGVGRSEIARQLLQAAMSDEALRRAEAESKQLFLGLGRVGGRDAPP